MSSLKLRWRRAKQSEKGLLTARLEEARGRLRATPKPPSHPRPHGTDRQGHKGAQGGSLLPDLLMGLPSCPAMVRGTVCEDQSSVSQSGLNGTTKLVRGTWTRCQSRNTITL